VSDEKRSSEEGTPMLRRSWMASPVLVLTLIGVARPSGSEDVGPLVRALWLVQRHGTPEALDPRNDQKLKGTLAKALGKELVLTSTQVKGLMEPSTFAGLAGPDERLDPREVRMALEADRPESRKCLLPQVAAHADYLTTTFDQI